MFLVLVNDKTGVLKDLIHVGFDRKEAEQIFLCRCDEGCKPIEGKRYERLYDRDDALDDGYLAIPCVGVIMFIDTSNCVEDEATARRYRHCLLNSEGVTKDG